MANDSDKIIATLNLGDYEIWTDSGWETVTDFHLTKEYEVWEVVTRDYRIEAADNHIIFDGYMCEVFVKNLSVGDVIQTESGPQRVESIVNTHRKVHMFDLTVDSDNHRFYGNGILSHNTSIATAIILHFAIFNKDKLIGILANKGEQAREILHRIKLAYEYLPPWLKCGVVEWNKSSVEFENGSKIIAAASSSSAVRGRTLSLVYLDECLAPETKITIRNKKTGEILNLSIEEAYNLI